MVLIGTASGEEVLIEGSSNLLNLMLRCALGVLGIPQSKNSVSLISLKGSTVKITGVAIT